MNIRPASKVGRKRRAAGWTLLALGMIVTLVWMGSIFKPSFLSGRGLTVDAMYGVVRAFYDSDLRGHGFTAGAYLPQRGRVAWTVLQELELRPKIICGVVAWWRDTSRSHVGTHWYVQIVLWPIPLLLWTPAAPLLRAGIRARRRAIANVCPTCGYSLTGLGDGASCPECGRA